ncbi:hypothetical protein BC829DRAFT_400922, partial [Chytridium lagenaria]
MASLPPLNHGLDTLVSSLVPTLVAASCANGPDRKGKPLRVPCLVECTGVVVILDLSGYTSLSELLFRGSDHAGGERLFKTVNPFFGEIIDTIHGWWRYYQVLWRLYDCVLDGMW